MVHEVFTVSNSVWNSVITRFVPRHIKFFTLKLLVPPFIILGLCFRNVSIYKRILQVLLFQSSFHSIGKNLRFSKIKECVNVKNDPQNPEVFVF